MVYTYDESGKYVTFTDEKGDKAKVTINQEAIDKDLELAGYNLLVTSEVKMPDQEIYNAYHSMCKIEETFKIMKSDLDAGPVFTQKENTIKGHFLICYIDILLERLLEIKVLGNEFCSFEIFDFTKDFNATKAGREYLNTAKSSKIIDALAEKFNLPITNYYLKPKQIKEILTYQLPTKFTALSRK